MLESLRAERVVAGNRGGGKHGSLTGALEKIFYKMFRILYLRKLLAERAANPEFADQEEARRFLFLEFDKIRAARIKQNYTRKSRAKKHAYLSRLGLLKSLNC